MDIYKELRQNLIGYTTDEFYGDYHYDDKIFPMLESEDIFNDKGMDFNLRFRDIISDPNNLFIERSSNSGNLENGVITLHNDINVYDNCYYDDFTNILKLNKGVHEPSEERAFSKVLKCIGDDSVMVELGSYWAFYSMWFLKEKKKGKTYCVEADEKCLEVGKSNFKLNGFEGSFQRGFIGHNQMNLLNYIESLNLPNIDILHSDIQGFEFVMLNQIKTLLDKRAIQYLFISTHSDKIHYDCIKLLRSVGYRIICSCDFDTETFQYDGFILCCPEEIKDIDNFYIGNRKKSKLITETYFNEIKKSKKL